MAEIRIEEKKNPWLPILLGLAVLLLVGAIAYAIVHNNNEKNEVVMEDNRAKAVATSMSAAGTIKPIKVDEEDFNKDWDGSNASYEDNYIYYISSLDQLNADMGVHHEYSSIALKALANSLVALSREQGMTGDVAIESSTQFIREQANAITEDWKSTKHADMIRAAAMTASEVIDEIQDANFPNMEDEVAELTEMAKAIDAETLTLDQKSAVKRFYRKAADVLGQMRIS